MSTEEESSQVEPPQHKASPVSQSHSPEEVGGHSHVGVV